MARRELVTHLVTPETIERVFSCGAAARRLPRVCAGGWMAGSALLALRLGGQTQRGIGLSVALLVAGVGAIASLWILRQGSFVRSVIRVGTAGVTFAASGRESFLPYDSITDLRFEAPLGSSRRWLAAVVLGDREGRVWPICAQTEEVGELIDTLIRRSGRNDLRAWADALNLTRALSLGWAERALNLTVAAGVVLGGALFPVR